MFLRSLWGPIRVENYRTALVILRYKIEIEAIQGFVESYGDNPFSACWQVNLARLQWYLKQEGLDEHKGSGCEVHEVGLVVYCLPAQENDAKSFFLVAGLNPLWFLVLSVCLTSSKVEKPTLG